MLRVNRKKIDTQNVFTGASLCWGWRVTFHAKRWAEICQDCWVHLPRQYIALPRPWLALPMDSSVSRIFCLLVPQICRSSGSSSLVYMSGPGLCGVEVVVGGDEGVGAVDHPGASWCVLVGAAGGVVFVVHEGPVRGGGQPRVVGVGDVARDVVPEFAQGGHAVDPRPPFQRHGVDWGGLLQSPGSQDLWAIHRDVGILELSISGLLGTQCSCLELPYSHVAPLKAAYLVLVIQATYQGPTSENVHATQWLSLKKGQVRDSEREKDHPHVQGC